MSTTYVMGQQAMAGFDPTPGAGMTNGGDLQGATVLAMRNAGFPEDQIDTVMNIRENHDSLAQIDIIPLMAPENEELRDQFMPYFMDDERADALELAMGEDEHLHHRINHLLNTEDGPEQLSVYLTQAEEEGADLADLITNGVNNDVIEGRIHAERQQEGFMSGINNMFQGIFSDNFDLAEMGGSLLTGFLGMLANFSSGINDVFGDIFNSITGMGESDALVGDGNGHATTGPGAQFREAFGAEALPLYNQEGELALPPTPEPDTQTPEVTARTPGDHHPSGRDPSLDMQ